MLRLPKISGSSVGVNYVWTQERNSFAIYIYICIYIYITLINYRTSDSMLIMIPVMTNWKFHSVVWMTYNSNGNNMFIFLTALFIVKITLIVSKQVVPAI